MKTTTLLIACLTLGSVATAADNSHLVRLYEEEILAHDLYVALGKKHPDIRPLQNIPHSEARHREMMAEILKAEGIAIPKPPEGQRFTTKGLDRTYRQWLKEGRRSEVDACLVGVRLEDHDIADLRAAQKAYPAHKEALGNLEAASNNHLRAFHRNMVSRGGKYDAEALPAADFTAIVEGDMQRGACGGDCGKCEPDDKRADCGKCGRGPGAGQGQDRPRGRKGQGRGNGRGRQGGRGPNR